MSHQHSHQMSESIDQVVQNGQSYQQLSSRDNQNQSNVSVNRTAPLSPLPRSAGGSRKEYNTRPVSQSSYENQRRTVDRESPKTASMRQDYDNSIGSGSTAVVSSNRDNMTDFFSWEVFQIVLHNPTTAHRFLRFCQSRACGENITFLQHVSIFLQIDIREY